MDHSTCLCFIVLKLATTFSVLLACAFAHVDIQPVDAAQVKFAEIKPAVQAAIRQYAPRVLESLIDDASECLRDTLKKGDEELGIPPVDPLQILDSTIDFDSFDIISDYIKGSLNLQDFYAVGLTSWKFTQLSDSITVLPPGYTIRFTLVFPAVSASGAYNGRITLLDEYEVFGQGIVAGSLSDLQISGVASIGILGGIHLRSLIVRVSVGDINFTITGLLNDPALSQLVSEFISNEVADIINDNQELIGGYIEDLVFELIDKIQEGGSGSENELIQGLINKCLPL